MSALYRYDAFVFEHETQHGQFFGFTGKHLAWKNDLEQVCRLLSCDIVSLLSSVMPEPGAKMQTRVIDFEGYRVQVWHSWSIISAQNAISLRIRVLD